MLRTARPPEPLIGDEVDRRLAARMAAVLRAAGIKTLVDLTLRVRRRRWWTAIPGLGVAGARQIEAFFAITPCSPSEPGAGRLVQDAGTRSLGTACRARGPGWGKLGGSVGRSEGRLAGGRSSYQAPEAARILDFGIRTFCVPPCLFPQTKTAFPAVVFSPELLHLKIRLAIFGQDEESTNA